MKLFFHSLILKSIGDLTAWWALGNTLYYPVVSPYCSQISLVIPTGFQPSRSLYYPPSNLSKIPLNLSSIFTKSAGRTEDHHCELSCRNRNNLEILRIGRTELFDAKVLLPFLGCLIIRWYFDLCQGSSSISPKYSKSYCEYGIQSWIPDPGYYWFTKNLKLR